MNYYNRNDILLMTENWTGERFPDGRPRVSDEVLNRLKNITAEEAWMPLWKADYKHQFEGRLRMIQPGKRLIGRAVTAVMVPSRPDVHMRLLNYGWQDENRVGFFNQWVIDDMQENDVLVVDMFDKVSMGTFVGGNLSMSIRSRTKEGGAVIWGGIRDLEQIQEMGDFQVYYRGFDPSPIQEVMMTGINVPCRIGDAICMPGDVVLGTIAGIVFIPAVMAEEVAVSAEKTKVRDLFGFERLAAQVYTGAQIDAAVWSKDIMDDFYQWFKSSETTAQYQHLNWDKELEESKDVAPFTFTGLSF